MANAANKYDFELYNILKEISKPHIQQLKDSPKNSDWSNKVWSHGKHYERESFKGVQETAIAYTYKNQEAPASRVIFFEDKSGRYGLEGVKIAYFGKNIMTTSDETTPGLQEQPFLKKNYWEGKCDLHPNTTKHDNKFKIKSDSMILDLRSKRGLFFQLVRKGGYKYGDLFQTAIRNEDPEAYVRTRAIAKWAFENGFDGIVWISVYDTNGKCLVMFTKDRVIKIRQ